MADAEFLRVEMKPEEDEHDFYIRAMGEIATGSSPAGILIKPHNQPRTFYRVDAIRLLKRWRKDYEKVADPNKFRQAIEKIIGEAATARKRVKAIDETLKKLDMNKQ